MSRIPSLPRSKVDKVAVYADHTDSWIDIDAELDKEKLLKHTIKHHHFEIRYSIAYKNNEDDNTIGELPIRRLTFQDIQKSKNNTFNDKEVNDFVKRTLSIFKFKNPQKIREENGNLHYYEQLFSI